MRKKIPWRRFRSSCFAMFDSKLLEIVRAMTPEEIAGFSESPFYNDRRNRKEISLLFKFIIRDHPACIREELSKENTHRHLFGDKPFVENRLNHIMTALLRLIESHIGYVYSGALVESRHLFALSRFYQERNLTQRFDATISRLGELLEGERPQDEESIWLRFRLEYLKHLQVGLYNPRSADLNLFPVLDSLEKYYITQRLILSAGLLEQNHFFRLDTSRTKLIFNQLSEHGSFSEYVDSNPLILTHYKLLPLLTDDADLEYVNSYRDLLKSMRSELAPQHLKGLYTLVRNYLVRAYNRGNSDMLPILFDNLKEEYEQGFLMEANNMYRASTVQNVVTTALKLKQFEWVFSFMSSCRDRITGTSQPENIVIFNEANYFFHTGNFDAAFDTTFHLLKYDNFYYSLAARRLEIKIWFEKADHQMAEYRLNALKSYLFSNKDKMPEQIRRNNDDFVDVVRQILSPRNRSNPKRMSMVQEKMLNTYKNIAEREWLLEKIQA